MQKQPRDSQDSREKDEEIHVHSVSIFLVHVSSCGASPAMGILPDFDLLIAVLVVWRALIKSESSDLRQGLILFREAIAPDLRIC